MTNPYRILFHLFISLIGLFLWWSVYSTTPINFRGININTNDTNTVVKYEAKTNESTYCHSLPQCLRPGVFLTINGFHYIIIDPLFRIFNLGDSPSINTLNLASQILISFYLVSVFIGLGIFNDSLLIGVFSQLSFILTPLLLQNVGLVQYDFLILFFWFIISMNIKKLILSKAKSKPIIFLIIGIAGTIIMENTGIAFSISAYLIFFSTSKLKLSKAFNNLGILAFLASIISIFIGLILSYRHDSVHWVSLGKNFDALYEIYGSRNTLFFLIKMTFNISILSIIFPFLLSLYYMKFNLVAILRRYYFFIKNRGKFTIFLFVGFYSTALVGLYVSGFTDEWTRQLLPVSLMLNIHFFQFVTLLKKQKRI
ncbi:MAG: hypothetical protein MH321_13695 [Leptospiraceae bacterium]|nr:hypothetical protein [Leptospiraceae bacterium]